MNGSGPRVPVEPALPRPNSDAVRNDPSRLNDLGRQMGTDTRQVRRRKAPAGSQFSRAHRSQIQNTSNGLTMKQNLSGIDDVDVTQVLVRLVAQQVAVQAALAATARAITPSLTEFLR
jgi:flagellin-like hook-associated protein FlgL